MTDDEREDRLLEIEEVAARAGMHPATVRQWCREGILEAIRLPHKWLISESAWQDFLASRTG